MCYSVNTFNTIEYCLFIDLELKDMFGQYIQHNRLQYVYRLRIKRKVYIPICQMLPFCTHVLCYPRWYNQCPIDGFCECKTTKKMFRLISKTAWQSRKNIYNATVNQIPLYYKLHDNVTNSLYID